MAGQLQKQGSFQPNTKHLTTILDNMRTHISKKNSWATQDIIETVEGKKDDAPKQPGVPLIRFKQKQIKFKKEVKRQKSSRTGGTKKGKVSSRTSNKLPFLPKEDNEEEAADLEVKREVQFTMYEDILKQQQDLNAPFNFLIEKNWMDGWFKFMKEEGDEPGEIDNRSVFSLIQQISKGEKEGSIKEVIYQIPHKLWVYLHKTYGGGPPLHEKISQEQ